MPEREIKWLHSHGWDNKNPDYDLGGNPSKFEIAELPHNNLFDDITPEEAQEGYTDYRCFYIVNNYLDTDYDITLDSSPASCTTVTVGSVIQNELQLVVFQGPSPSMGGYFICQMDWGPQLTVYWNGSYSAMAADMQTKLQLVQYCTGVTVALTNTFPNDAGAEFTVTFAGQVQNRKMGLIRVLQNNLRQGGMREYRVDDTGAMSISVVSGVSICYPTNAWNCQGNSIVQVHELISNIPSTGWIHIPYPYNDTITPTPSTFVYMHLSYSSYSSNKFVLAQPIPTIPIPPPDLDGEVPVFPYCPCLGNNDEVWVDIPSFQTTTVNISRIQAGSPIKQIAEIIDLETIEPADWTDPGASFHVGLIKPLEGFYVWVKRVTPPGSPGCQDGFNIVLNGTRVS